MLCVICGDEKERKEFHKVKGFEKYSKVKRRCWCKSCQKDFITLKEIEDKQKQVKIEYGSFLLTFN